VVIYTVHTPPNVSSDRLESAEQLVFVKDGFSWWAALVPPVWLLSKRMWLEFAIYLAATALIVWAFTSAGAADAGNAILLIAQIVFGFEAGALYGAALERRGWRRVGTVSGRNAEDCERRFLEVWLPTHTEIPRSAPGVGPAVLPAQSWGQVALARAKDALARGRRTLAGA
jgi:uncharacterized protein DUF2628